VRETKLRRIRIKQTTGTTVPGFENGNGQRVVRDTGFASESFPGQRVYHLRCKRCKFQYGANGTDILKRLCPRCQGGAKGERLRDPGPSLFAEI
jgi:hypothetical protein